jgi:hypothetical protein
MRVYLAGPYRAKTENGVFENILLARDYAIRLIEAGHAPLCPHMNTAFMGGVVPDGTFLDIDLAWLIKADAILMLPRWEQSEGARIERAFAETHKIPVYYVEGGVLPKALA